MDGQSKLINETNWLQLLRQLRTRGSWVQILPGAPFFKGLERKTKSSLLLWDRCVTFYPPVLATSMRLKGLACKTKCSFLCCGTLWEFLSTRP